MTGRDFFDNVAAHPDLEWLGVIDSDNPEAIVRNIPRETIHAISLHSIMSESWAALEGVLTAKRTAKIMRYVTRVIGYYSSTWNWNASKLAELADRHKGQYTLPEVA